MCSRKALYQLSHSHSPALKKKYFKWILSSETHQVIVQVTECSGFKLITALSIFEWLTSFGQLCLHCTARRSLKDLERGMCKSSLKVNWGFWQVSLLACLSPGLEKHHRYPKHDSEPQNTCQFTINPSRFT